MEIGIVEMINIKVKNNEYGYDPGYLKIKGKLPLKEELVIIM